MKITTHFTLLEFACRDGTPYPTRWIESRLYPLCETLETIRTRVGKPVRVLSGYRTETYNRRVGGARRSQHVEGRAADIKVAGLTAAALHAVVLALRKGNCLPRLGGLGLYPGFVHVDVRPWGCLARWTGRRVEAEVAS